MSPVKNSAGGDSDPLTMQTPDDHFDSILEKNSKSDNTSEQQNALEESKFSNDIVTHEDPNSNLVPLIEEEDDEEEDPTT